jgi:hypothetical protein
MRSVCALSNMRSMTQHEIHDTSCIRCSIQIAMFANAQKNDFPAL